MDDQYKKEVGQRLFEVRHSLNLSRAELGKRLGMHETSVKRYEDGAVSTVDLELMSRFAEELDADLLYILGWDGDVADVKPKDEYESRLLVMARHAGKSMNAAQREQLLENLESTISMYLTATELADPKDNTKRRKKRRKKDDSGC